jgi:hypothetical protein
MQCLLRATKDTSSTVTEEKEEESEALDKGSFAFVDSRRGVSLQGLISRY